jgi:ankyrin repeat protein
MLRVLVSSSKLHNLSMTEAKKYLSGNHFLQFTISARDKIQWMQFFIDSGCSIDDKDNAGNTVLHIALQHKHPKLIVYIMEELQADIDIANHEGWKPITLLVGKPILSSKYIVSLIEMMINAGIRLNTLAPNGDTLLHLACLNKHSSVIRYLLKCNIDAKYVRHAFDVNTKNSIGKTALRICIENNDIASVSTLFAYANDLDITENVTLEMWSRFISLCINSKNSKLAVVIIGALNKIASGDDANEVFAKDCEEPALFRAEGASCSIVSIYFITF